MNRFILKRSGRFTRSAYTATSIQPRYLKHNTPQPRELTMTGTEIRENIRMGQVEVGHTLSEHPSLGPVTELESTYQDGMRIITTKHGERTGYILPANTAVSVEVPEHMWEN